MGEGIKGMSHQVQYSKLQLLFQIIQTPNMFLPRQSFILLNLSPSGRII